MIVMEGENRRAEPIPPSKENQITKYQNSRRKQNWAGRDGARKLLLTRPFSIRSMLRTTRALPDKVCPYLAKRVPTKSPTSDVMKAQRLKTPPFLLNQRLSIGVSICVLGTLPWYLSGPKKLKVQIIIQTLQARLGDIHTGNGCHRRQICLLDCETLIQTSKVRSHHKACRWGNASSHESIGS